MKTDVIVISNDGENMEEALAQAEKVACYKELPSRNAMHLRLLTEEMLGMMRSITGERKGAFWIEDHDGMYELHLQVETPMDFDKQERLLAASTSGKMNQREESWERSGRFLIRWTGQTLRFP